MCNLLHGAVRMVRAATSVELDSQARLAVQRRPLAVLYQFVTEQASVLCQLMLLHGRQTSA